MSNREAAGSRRTAQPLGGEPAARVLVAGASGLAGALAAELVWRHPRLELVAADALSEAGVRLDRLHPRRRVPLVLEELDLGEFAIRPVANGDEVGYVGDIERIDVDVPNHIAADLIPVIAACVEAISGGVAAAHIIDGRRPIRSSSSSSPTPGSGRW